MTCAYFQRGYDHQVVQLYSQVVSMEVPNSLKVKQSTTVMTTTNCLFVRKMYVYLQRRYLQLDVTTAQCTRKRTLNT